MGQKVETVVTTPAAKRTHPRLNYYQEWHTHNEIQFLRMIERHYPPRPRQPNPNRMELLRRYREGCRKRTDWGDIDRDAVMAYLDLELGDAGGSAAGGSKELERRDGDDGRITR